MVFLLLGEIPTLLSDALHDSLYTALQDAMKEIERLKTLPERRRMVGVDPALAGQCLTTQVMENTEQLRLAALGQLANGCDCARSQQRISDLEAKGTYLMKRTAPCPDNASWDVVDGVCACDQGYWGVPLFQEDEWVHQCYQGETDSTWTRVLSCADGGGTAYESRWLYDQTGLEAVIATTSRVRICPLHPRSKLDGCITSKPNGRAVQNLKNYVTVNYQTDSSDGNQQFDGDEWTGSAEALVHAWYSCGLTDSDASPAKLFTQGGMFYWACNNGAGAHGGGIHIGGLPLVGGSSSCHWQHTQSSNDGVDVFLETQ